MRRFAVVIAWAAAPVLAAAQNAVTLVSLSGRNVVWLMNGSVRTAGLFTTPDSVPDTNWEIAGTHDFDADGHGVARRRVVPTTPAGAGDANWIASAVGDYSGDGAPDVLWRHALSGQLVVWEMNGLVRVAGTFTTPSALPDANWRIAGPR